MVNVIPSCILTVAAIIAVVINSRKNNTEPVSQISNLKSEIPCTRSWRGWPADAPPPAIAPFNAEQAKQHQVAWAKYLKSDVEYTKSIGSEFFVIKVVNARVGMAAKERKDRKGVCMARRH